MKKIFAIALAVVMVLSMASAFARSECATWGTDWSCAADELWCGQGKVEVVPYVKVNTACGYEYQVSDCASAIRTEDVYFAIKVTAEAYPDPAWWTQAVLDLETEGLVVNGKTWTYEDTKAEMANLYALIDQDATEEKVYYVNQKINALADSSVKGFDVEPYIFAGYVEVATVCDELDYSVCATLSSYYDGASISAYNKVGDYLYGFPGYAASMVDPDDTNEVFNGTFFVKNEKGTKEVTFTVVDGSITKAEWNDDDFYAQVMADFGLTACGTAACITEANILKNFGWDDEQEHCFDWSTKGASVVDTDCVVAIPKTGDASVLAWLF